MTLAAPEHQEMNGQVEVKCMMLRKISHSLMVYARVLEAYIHFALMFTADRIFPFLPIKYLMREYGNPTTPFKLATGAKPSVLHLRVLFFSCDLRKSTAYVDKKALYMSHQAQKSFHGIFVGIQQHQKGYLVYVLSTRKIISSYDVIFYEIFLVR